MILAGDVGGTKTALALFAAETGCEGALREAVYPSRDHPGLLPILRDFLGDEGPRVRAACVGIAGPVEENRCVVPNLPWVVDGDDVAAAAGLPGLVLLNDLVAAAEALPALREEDLAVVQEGVACPGAARALIAAGTGLGMTVLPPSGPPLPGEGGHAGFSPRNAEESALLSWLRARHGRVSRERVVSGPGLADIYRFLGEADGAPAGEALASEDPAGAIAEAALRGRCPLAARALALFLGAYGSAAGDLALTVLARGGVFVGGGIAPKLLPAIREGGFLEAFLDKGRFRGLLERIPVRVVLRSDAAVLGAARRARRALRGG